MKLSANKRETVGKKVKKLRREGITPAAVFGSHRASTNIEFNTKEFSKIFKEAGFNQFFDLELEGEKPIKVLVKDIQVHPVTDEIWNVGLYEVKLNEEVTVDVPVELTGESQAVKLNTGFLVTQMETIKIKALPNNIPAIIVVDVSKLDNPGDNVLVSSLALGEGVELDPGIDPEQAVVYVQTAQMAEEPEEEAAPAEGVEGAEATAEGGEATAEGEEKAE